LVDKKQAVSSSQSVGDCKVAQRIGILSSTGYGGTTPTIFADFKAAFENATSGYGSTPAYAGVTVQAKGKYSASGKINRQLYRGLTLLQTAAQPADIVIALGGLVAAHAAVDRAEKPFLVLIGRVPEESDFVLTDNPNYMGGVNLHTAHNNMDRRDALITAFSTSMSPIVQKDVWLLYNPNSRMGRSEVHEWKAQGGRAVAAATPVEDMRTATTRLSSTWPSSGYSEMEQNVLSLAPIRFFPCNGSI
jgi:hypothetical protein